MVFASYPYFPLNLTARGMSLGKVSYWAFVFSVFSRNHEKTKTCHCTDWLSATQNALGAAEGFSTHQDMNPNRQTLCYQSLPLSHWFILIARKKGIWPIFCISQPATNFFACRTVVIGLFKLNIKARHEIPEFLNANLWLIHLITFNIDWSWNIFTLHNFSQCSAAHWPRKSENWELEI